jgi:hypothetical protein
MKKLFVKTSNYTRFMRAVDRAESRGSPEAAILLVTGQAGEGKTATLEHWSVEVGAVHLRAKADWTLAYFKRDLCAAMRIDPHGHADTVFNRVMNRLGTDRTPVVIDEARFCLRDNAAALQKARECCDLAEVLLVLGGIPGLENSIAKHDEISSRVASWVEFAPSTIADVRLVANELSEVPLADDLVAQIQAASDGRIRLVRNAIAVAETIGKRARLKLVSAADVAGQELVYDWQARRKQSVHARLSKPVALGAVK